MHTLEERLSEVDARSSIKDDRELARVLEDIISEEEANGITEENVDIVAEATEMLLSLRGIDKSETEKHASELLDSFTVERKKQTRFTEKSVRFTGTLRRAAVFALAVLSALTLTVTLNEDVRATVQNKFISWISGIAVIDFSDSEDKGTVRDTSIEIDESVIPEGFEKTAEIRKDDEVFYRYRHPDGDFVIIEVIMSEPAVVIHRSEEHRYSEIYLGSYEAYSFYNEEEHSGSILYGDNDRTVIISGNTDYETLLSVARGLIGAKDNK